MAIVGKQACAAGVLGKGLNRAAIGIGMIPRGEVGLIFANIGLGLVVNGVACRRSFYLLRCRRDGDRDDGAHPTRAPMVNGAPK